MTKEWITYQVKKAIKEIDPDAKVILFGSKARGEDNEYSDWDFLILSQKPVDEKKKRLFRASLIDTELEAEEVISTIIYSEKTWLEYRNTLLFRNISKDGIEI